MLLLIAGKPTAKFANELSTYKWRNHIKLFENLTATELANITAAAYSLVFPVTNDVLATPVLQAMQCQVPVIVANTDPMRSICGEAAIYCNATNFNDIAQKMILVFKEEEKMKDMAVKGKMLMQKHDAGKASEILMQQIKIAYES